ncbi:MAG: 3-oxoacyl-[acyl-carrier-protein] reductase [Vulcanimicrobiaceae bacterium]
MNAPLTVLVTGGGRGIGRAVAEVFQGEGHTVLAPTRAEMDLAATESVETYVRSIASERVDVLVNNAAENEPQLLEDIAAPTVDRMLAINIRAPFLLTKLLGVDMASRGWGRIVNLSSVYSLVSRPKRSMYTTTKAALNGLTKASAVELAHGNVLVNAVCPGFVDTDLTRQNNSPDEIARLCGTVPLARLADPSEIARLIYFLGSHQNSYITGQTIVIDGGFTCQ